MNERPAIRFRITGKSSAVKRPTPKRWKMLLLAGFGLPKDEVGAPPDLFLAWEVADFVRRTPGTCRRTVRRGDAFSHLVAVAII